MLRMRPPQVPSMAGAGLKQKRMLCIPFKIDLSYSCTSPRGVLTCRPLRCADVSVYDSIADSPVHGLSFRPIPMVAGALMLKRWIVQNGTFPPVVSDAPFWTIHRFNMRAPTTMGIGRNESPCTGLSVILSKKGTSAHQSERPTSQHPFI